MADRGAGITLPKALVEGLIAAGLFDSDFPFIPADERVVSTREGEGEREITRNPMLLYGTNWSDIYENLRRRIPDEDLYINSEVVGVEMHDEEPEDIHLCFSETSRSFDFVFFADGYQSVGRQVLFPKVETKYAGYVAWRGALSNPSSGVTDQLLGKVPVIGYPKGHLLAYAIPDPVSMGSSLANWVFYERVDETHPLIAAGMELQRNYALGSMPAVAIEYVRGLAKEYLTPFGQAMVLPDQDYFMQAIYDRYVSHAIQGRAALAGDAAIMCRPHVGSGAAKALESALVLQQLLSTEPDFFKAVAAWGEQQDQVGEKLFHLARALGAQLVTQTPVWETLTADAFNHASAEILAGNSWYVKPD